MRNATVMRSVLPQFRRNKINITGILTVILAAMAGVVICQETFAQMTVYTVSELSAGVPSRLNNLGDVAGRADDSFQGRSELLSGITASTSFGQSIWVSFTAATMVPLRASTMREKSLERRIPLSRSFHLSGRLGAAFAGVRSWLAITADRRSASIGTAIWLDTLRARMAGELSCGRDAGASATSAFCPGAITAARLTSTTWMRLRGHLEARPVSVPSFGRQTAIYAILGRYRGIRQVRLARSIIMGMSLGTRKVHGACAHFCGLKQLECRIWGRSTLETPVERSV